MIQDNAVSIWLHEGTSCGNNGEKDIVDYKIMCFNGQPRIIFTCTERHSKNGLKVTFFDEKWNRMPFERHYPSSKEEIKRPQNLEQMLSIAQTLSKGLPFVRVDLYEVDGTIYFGELTLFPGDGFEEFTPAYWGETLGEWIDLQSKEQK